MPVVLDGPKMIPRRTGQAAQQFGEGAPVGGAAVVECDSGDRHPIVPARACGYLFRMAKRDPINSGSSKSYRSAISGRFVTVKHGKASPSTTIKEGVAQGKPLPASTIKESPKGVYHYRSATTGRFLTSKGVKADPGPTAVRRSYEMPNGEKIVTIRRDIVDRALNRKK